MNIAVNPSFTERDREVALQKLMENVFVKEEILADKKRGVAITDDYLLKLLLVHNIAYVDFGTEELFATYDKDYIGRVEICYLV